MTADWYFAFYWKQLPRTSQGETRMTLTGEQADLLDEMQTNGVELILALPDGGFINLSYEELGDYLEDPNAFWKKKEDE